MKNTLLLAASCLAMYCFAPACRTKETCPAGSHTTFTIVNNSSDTIMLREYPDSVWKYQPAVLTAGPIKIAPGGTHQKATESGNCWENYYSGSKSTYYFLFHIDTVNALGWSAISGTNRGLLKRAHVNISYLQQHNFTITYP